MFECWNYNKKILHSIHLYEKLLETEEISNLNALLGNTLPKAIVLKTTIDIFVKYIYDYLLTYAKDLKHQEKLTTDKSTSIGKTLRRENILNPKTKA